MSFFLLQLILPILPIAQFLFDLKIDALTSLSYKLKIKLKKSLDSRAVTIKTPRTRYEICLRLTKIKTPEGRGSGVFADNFGHISHIFLVFLLLTLSK